MPSVRKPNRRARLHRRSAQRFCATRRIVGQNANTRHVVVARQLTACFQLVDRQDRIQQRVVDHFSDIEIRVWLIHRTSHVVLLILSRMSRQRQVHCRSKMSFTLSRLSASSGSLSGLSRAIRGKRSAYPLLCRSDCITLLNATSITIFGSTTRRNPWSSIVCSRNHRVISAISLSVNPEYAFPTFSN